MTIDDSYSKYMYDFIEEICEKFGPRYSCSKAEKEANKWIKKELETFCDETNLDEFKTRPGLYPQGLIKVAGILSGISILFISFKFPFSIISFILVLLGLIVLYTELFLMKGWIGFLFKKRTSSNVFGILKPTNTTKFRLIFEGHTDSAKEMNIASYNEKLRYLIAVLGILFIVFTPIISIWKFIAQLLYGTAFSIFSWGVFSWTILDFIYYIPSTILFPFFLILVKGFLGNKVVLGANDNLSGSAVAIALGKYLSKNRPKYTEIWICSQGSEEVGDRGASYFVKKYGDQGYLDNAYNIVLECCGAGEAILLVEKDMHKKVYSKEINEKLKIAYENVKRQNPNIFDLKVDRLKIGACDAGSYIEEGYKATGIFGTEKNKNKAVNWHSTEDRPANISKKVLNYFLLICFEIVNIIDSEFES